MRAAQITPKKVQNIIEGAEAAGRDVDRIEIDGIVVHLVKSNEDGAPPDNGSGKGLGKKSWSKS